MQIAGPAWLCPCLPGVSMRWTWPTLSNRLRDFMARDAIGRGSDSRYFPSFSDSLHKTFHAALASVMRDAEYLRIVRDCTYEWQAGDTAWATGDG